MKSEQNWMCKYIFISLNDCSNFWKKLFSIFVNIKFTPLKMNDHYEMTKKNQ